MRYIRFPLVRLGAHECDMNRNGYGASTVSKNPRVARDAIRWDEIPSASLPKQQGFLSNRRHRVSLQTVDTFAASLKRTEGQKPMR